MRAAGDGPARGRAAALRHRPAHAAVTRGARQGWRAVQVLDLYTGELRRLLRGHLDTISGLCYHPSLQARARPPRARGPQPRAAPKLAAP
jgi:hypothetical protein